MKKTLYSLMLSEDVVREVDALARREGTNRSQLVNRILAEYVGLPTPERRIDDIFRRMEQLLLGDRELVPYAAPNATTLSLKSSLQYRYRPTVKYSVELFRDRSGAAGELSVLFRTQSVELLGAMENYFRTLKAIEDALLCPALPIEYTLCGGRFTRSIRLDEAANDSADTVAAAISAYVRLFDALMKACLAGAGPAVLASRYRAWLDAGNICV